MFVRWRYYLKMLRYEQFLIPLALLPLFVLATLLVRDNPNNRTLASETGLTFIEGVLPLVGAVVGSTMLLGDPLLELQYTLPRPLWRTQLERLAVLGAVLALFYGLFVLIIRGAGVEWPGWSGGLSGALVWLGPTMLWTGLALLLTGLLRNAAAGGGLTALLWIFTFFIHDTLLDYQWGRLWMPQMTIFSPDEADWPLNRLVLIGLGVLFGSLALLIMRPGENIIGSEK